MLFLYQICVLYYRAMYSEKHTRTSLQRWFAKEKLFTSGYLPVLSSLQQKYMDTFLRNLRNKKADLRLPHGTRTHRHTHFTVITQQIKENLAEANVHKSTICVYRSEITIFVSNGSFLVNDLNCYIATTTDCLANCLHLTADK